MNGKFFCLFVFFCWENRFNWLWLYNNMNFYSIFRWIAKNPKKQKTKNPIYKTNNRICTVIYEKPERLNINEWWWNKKNYSFKIIWAENCCPTTKQKSARKKAKNFLFESQIDLSFDTKIICSDFHSFI